MTKPKANLLCARFWKPDLQWREELSGEASASEDGKPIRFGLHNPSDLQSVTMKLESEHGWKIRKVSDQWRAEKHGEWHERPILEDLVVLMVERVGR